MRFMWRVPFCNTFHDIEILQQASSLTPKLQPSLIHAQILIDNCSQTTMVPQWHLDWCNFLRKLQVCSCSIAKLITSYFLMVTVSYRQERGVCSWTRCSVILNKLLYIHHTVHSHTDITTKFHVYQNVSNVIFL